MQHDHALLRRQPGRGLVDRLGIDELGLRPPPGRGRCRRGGGARAGGSIASWARGEAPASAWSAVQGVGVVEAGARRCACSAFGARGDGAAGRAPPASAAARARFRPRPEAELAADAQEIGIASTRPRIVGDIQTNSEVAIMKADDAGDERRAPCASGGGARCRASGIEPSSRRCGFQPVSRPSRIWKTEPGLDQHQDRRDQRREQDLDQADSDEADAAAAGPPHRAVEQRQHEARTASARAGSPWSAPNSWSARSGSKRGQVGKSVNSLREIFRPDVGRLQHERDADHELQQPERRGEIGHDAGGEMLARRRASGPRAPMTRDMLQVALAPAPVAHREVDQRGRALLVGAGRGRAACRPSSRRAGSAPPRRSRG